MKIIVIDGIEYIKAEEVKKAETKRIKKAFALLTFSERVALKHILEKIEGTTGKVTTKDIANKCNITRSTCTNVLTKMEMLGVIESKSLGAKGTYINILDRTVFSEIEQEG